MNIDDKAVFSRLAGLPEAERRRILRPHDEAAFRADSDAEAMELRDRLDAALGRLLTLELEAEIAGRTGYLIDEPFLPTEPLGILAESHAFVRYLNAYLYFGVRMLFGRTAAILEAREQALKTKAAADKLASHGLLQRSLDLGMERLDGTDASAGTSGNRDCNRVPAGLQFPPPPETPIEKCGRYLNEYLSLKISDAATQALYFLDGFRPAGTKSSDSNYDLWLRGLWHDSSPSSRTEEYFALLTRGLIDWVNTRVDFYKLVEEDPRAGRDLAWIARKPLTARFAVVDLYWLSRVMRANISSAGRVTCAAKSWIDLIALSGEFAGTEEGKELQISSRLLRGVFDFACDLIQNSIELTEAAECARLENAQCPNIAVPQAAKWRQVFDEELAEIDRQKYLRNFHGPEPKKDCTPPDQKWDWSRRFITGEYPRQEVVGLAFSGGGIRSATFGLGVLQGLQDLDLLRSVDYLSTVSGGGYIGSWLAANVLRTPHWLGRQTNWEDSIGHLRRYSKYLAPHTGLFSADLWTMGGIWFRNAILVQLTAFIWLVFILATCLLGKPVFDAVNNNPTFLGVSGEQIAHSLAAVLAIWVAGGVGLNFWRDRPEAAGKNSFTEWQVQTRLVIPSLVSSFLTATLLWAQATGHSNDSPSFLAVNEYSAILLVAWKAWWSLLTVTLVGLTVLGARTQETRRWQAVFWAFIATIVLYLETCGVMYMFRQMAYNPSEYSWYAFVFGPALVLVAVTLAVILFIGLCGRRTSDRTREWWTRLGSWLGMYGAAYMIFAVASVLGPLWILKLFKVNWWGLKWGALAGYIGTVMGGLQAGKSSKTNGTGNTGLELLARAAAILFIIGGLLGAATVLHVFMVEAFTSLDLSTRYWSALNDVSPLWRFVAAAGALGLGFLLSARIELNIFGLNYFYRNRLMRCYLGATKWRPGMRKPNRFTGFDEKDDVVLADLSQKVTKACNLPFRGPFPIVNCTLNLGGSADLSVETRKSASFQLTPLRCGSDRARVGYARTSEYAGGIMLGQAVSVSGAAASPNMGYNSSTLVSFLLTLFNVRLGWWFPNPSQADWQKKLLPVKGFLYLVKELFGYAGEARGFLNISDGGHFENLGIYELVRRRTKVIVIADGECDAGLQFGSLGNVVRICETDFGAKIDIDVSSIRKQDNGFSRAHCAVGTITYSNGSRGWLIYLKSSISGDEDVGVAQYRAVHPDFPHESTADQFFTEDQFESYRRLGRHVVQHTLRGTEPATRFTDVAERLFDMWTPAGFSSESFLTHTKTLDTIWERFRKTAALHPLLQELTADRQQGGSAVLSPVELCACLELLQLMENVFIDLRLDDFWTHPDNRGWAMLFSSWAKSPKFQDGWRHNQRTFGIRFEYFCQERLGLEKEQPVARV